jgi:hypothetical protein
VAESIRRWLVECSRGKQQANFEAQVSYRSAAYSTAVFLAGKRSPAVGLAKALRTLVVTRVTIRRVFESSRTREPISSVQAFAIAQAQRPVPGANTPAPERRTR